MCIYIYIQYIYIYTYTHGNDNLPLVALHLHLLGLCGAMQEPVRIPCNPKNLQAPPPSFQVITFFGSRIVAQNKYKYIYIYKPWI